MSAVESSTLRLADPATFAAGVPHAAIDALRETTPVAWQLGPAPTKPAPSGRGAGSEDVDGEPGFWAVLRHADVVKVAREPVLFSATRGGVVLEDLPPDSLEMMRGMLLAMDPPRHLTYRKPLADSFKAKVIAGMEDQIRDLTRKVLADAAEKGEVDFVHDVAAHIPTQVMGRLMGLPEADWALLHTLAERQTSGQDPDVVGEVDHSASIEMAMYAIGFAAERRTQPPREDLTTLILDGDFGGTQMGDVDFGSFFVQLVTAGNDTTQTMLSSGLLALLAHPEQMAALRADRTLIAGAVEEILRWANPLHYFRRTASEDTVLGGQAIAAGDKVAMYYTAANRDPAVFADPHVFDITRSPNPHLSFGIAEHFCLGVHLARLEGRIFFEELLAAFPTIEPTGDPVRLRSNLNNSYKKVPVRLS
ncbi:MAG TPA: cytochrome P450 [Iamia sp.]|nr:cytochrome P450 [Iamia sp.]